MAYFLGIDGGQSHTTALVADSQGRILGRGGASGANHAREAGGSVRLAQSINQVVEEAVEGALRNAGLLKKKAVGEFRFASAHLAMAGESEINGSIDQGLLRSERLIVGHDAPGALAGALACGEGVVVLAGTGTVACGVTDEGRFVRVGGHGYLFGDEGGAFAIAREAILVALRNQDRDEPCGLTPALLSHFKRKALKEVIEAFYAGTLSRDRLASFAPRVGKLAEQGETPAEEIIDHAACALAEMAVVTALRLDFAQRPIYISYSGDVFNNTRLLTRFAAEVSIWLSRTQIVKPRFGPDVGALLLAYRQAGKKANARLLANLEDSYSGL
jgi:N-acetylglucosamine kinase-like BadF-type ATPase